MTPINFGSNSIHSLTLSISPFHDGSQNTNEKQDVFFPVCHYSQRSKISNLKLVKNPQKFIN